MIILEDLSPEKRKEYLEKDKPVQRLEDGFNYTYKSRYTNIYKIKNDTISHITSENILDIHLIKQHPEFYEFDLTISYAKVLQGLEMLPKFYLELMDKLSEIKNHLICRINESGLAIDILNKNELKEKWISIKNELINNDNLKNTFQEEDLKKIIDAGDLEYKGNMNTLIPDFNKNIVFMAFFLGLIDREKVSKRNFYSYIFPENSVSTGLTIENEEENDNLLTFSILGYNPSIDKSNFKKRYLSNFSFLHEPFQEYSFDFISLYTIEKATNRIENIRLTLDEKINESVSTNIICEIQKVENI